MRDRVARTWPERKLYYKVGSVFKGCDHCGELDEEGKKFTTGTNVYRSYKPWDMKWTYKCWDCGSTDLQCWADAIDIGMEPILGAREVVRKKKLMLRQMSLDQKAKVVSPDKAMLIAQLEQKLAKLEAMVSKEKGN